MGVLKKHLEILWKKFLIVRETDIRSKPLYQKGVGTPKTVILETDSEHFPNEHCSRMCLDGSKKNFELFYKSPLLLAPDMLY